MVKPGQGAGFIQEPGQAPVVVLRVRIGMGHHRARFRARGKLHRQVFLDSHELVQVGVIGPVGDAEAPGPQYRIQSVFLKARARTAGRSRGRWAWAGAGLGNSRIHGGCIGKLP